METHNKMMDIIDELKQHSIESLINKMNVANRDEFDILEKKLELLAKRVSKLEKRNIRKKKR